MDLSNEIDSLKDRIWKTKKSRMESEARMNKNGTLANTIVAYYTFVVLSFSIWALVLDVTKKSTLIVNVAAVIASVGLFGVSLLISTFNYAEKSFQFKSSYLDLDKLDYKINHFSRCVSRQTDEQNLNELYALETEYNNILSKTQNHHNIDYIKMLIDKNHTQVTLEMRKEYNFYKIKNKFSITSLFLIPILIAIGIAFNLLYF